MQYRCKELLRKEGWDGDLMDVGHVSVEATISAARPTAKTALKAASNPITASEESIPNRLSVNALQMKNDTPINNTETNSRVYVIAIRKNQLINELSQFVSFLPVLYKKNWKNST